YASSSSVYGANTSKPFSTSDNIDHPLSLYAATKKSNELMAHTYSHLYGLPTTGLRFFTVYGPWGRPDMALFLFTKAMVNDVPIEGYNAGRCVRGSAYIDDIVGSMTRLRERRGQPVRAWSGCHPGPGCGYARYKVYSSGNNSPDKLMGLIDAIQNELGNKAKQ